MKLIEVVAAIIVDSQSRIFATQRDFGSKYNHELLNGMFYHPYIKIEHVENNPKSVSC